MKAWAWAHLHGGAGQQQGKPHVHVKCSEGIHLNQCAYQQKSTVAHSIACTDVPANEHLLMTQAGSTVGWAEQWTQPLAICRVLRLPGAFRPLGKPQRMLPVAISATTSVHAVGFPGLPL
jgi:hypothetical protein